VKRRSKRRAGKQPARGRPSLFDAKIAGAIAARLADGEPLLAICRDDIMPHRATVTRWMLQHPGFCDMIRQARELGADALAEECLVIVDGAGDVSRDRLRFDARRWLVSKISPRRYAERVTTELSGPGGGPIRTAAVTALVPMPPLEVSRAVAALLSKAQKQLGLVPKARSGKQARAVEILGSGKPLPPEVYAALYAAGKASDER
jgi:terminase small subunit-like protein